MKQSQPRRFALEDLAKIVNDPQKKFEVVLHKSSKWIDWESSALLQGDARVLSVDSSKQWPLQVSFSGGTMDAQQAPFDPEMEFVLRTK